MNVLTNVPRLDQPGGVANYFRVLRSYLSPDNEYFEIGAKAGESGKVALVKRALVDYWQFHRKLSRGNYSLVHLNPSLVPKAIVRDALFLLIARAHSVPVLALFHGWDNNFQSLIERRWSGAFRFVFGRAAGLVVLADDFRRQIDAIGVRAPVFRITTCVDDEVFAAARAGEPKPQVKILYLSRLDHGKGVIESVRSFSELKRTSPHVTLTIAGDGPERAAVEQLIREQQLDDVILLGHIEGDEKKRVFVESDIYFFPTFFGEGMPTTVLEAMAHGLPVVTRLVGGLADFFENERMGFITESRDTTEFARLLELLVRDPALRRRVGEYNRKYALEHFAASKVAEGLQNLYVQVSR